jgi:hypothetical protein
VTVTACITWEVIARETGCFLRETIDDGPPAEWGPVPGPEEAQVLVTARRAVITDWITRQVRAA